MCHLHDEIEEHILMHFPHSDVTQPEELDIGTSGFVMGCVTSLLVAYINVGVASGV